MNGFVKESDQFVSIATEFLRDQQLSNTAIVFLFIKFAFNSILSSYLIVHEQFLKLRDNLFRYLKFQRQKMNSYILIFYISLIQSQIISQVRKEYFQNQQNMLRLLFKVHQVHLRLRQEIDVQIVIKKGQQNFIIPRKGKLINGLAVLDAHAQFFISLTSPTFDVYVMILHGSAKRFAGMCEIDLREWQESTNNSTTSYLQKSPDSKATILFDFFYLSCDVPFNGRNLISIGEYELNKKTNYIKSVEEKNNLLTHQNDRLIRQVDALRKQKEQLTLNKQFLTSQYAKNQQGYQFMLKKKQEEVQILINSSKAMRQKMSQIQQIINKYGQKELKQKMSDLEMQFSKRT